jgi:3-hydroxyisobutyrate dehydrogenase-like beta-hydroxyacid dehydrogenase
MVQCAYIGLGAMGNSMAGHIAKKVATLNYPPLLAFNRTQVRAEALEKTHPVKAVTSLEQVATQSDIIFSCLLNDAAVIETLDTLLPHLKSGSILVEQSTISPSLALEYAKKSKDVGVTYVSCPVMGPPVKAASGDLIVLMAGGNDEVRAKITPLLADVIGKKIIDLGQDDVGKSLRLKLCGNYFITSIVEMVAEGMTLGEASGVGQNKVKELLDSVFPGSLLGIYASRMLNNTYKDEIAFPITTAKKDVSHIVQLAKDSGASLPITEVFLENADKTLENHGNYDLSSIVGSKYWSLKQ